MTDLIHLGPGIRLHIERIVVVQQHVGNAPGHEFSPVEKYVVLVQVGNLVIPHPSLTEIVSEFDLVHVSGAGFVEELVDGDCALRPYVLQVKKEKHREAEDDDQGSFGIAHREGIRLGHGCKGVGRN